MHSVAPATLWNVPAAQSVHVGSPPLAVNVPGAHGTGSVEPVEHAEPAGHVVHALALGSPSAFEYEPAGHGSSAAAPEPQ